jgi:iron complex transport system substrate-binding protein
MKTRGLSIFLLALVPVFGLRIAAARPDNHPEQVVAFTDALGRQVEIPAPVRRIVTINGDAAEILCALGAEEQVVGVSTHIAANGELLSGLRTKAVVGTSMSPSIEKIIELQPDLVITYEMWMTREAFEDKLAPLGIPVARMYCYRLDHLSREIRLIGKLVGRPEAAEAYIRYFENTLQQVQGRLQGLGSKVRVYNEGYGPYKTVSDGSGPDKILARAGVRNIAAGQPVPWPEITAEWVVEQDPELIVKVASPAYIKTGYGIRNARAIDDFLAELTHRPAWQQIRAVRQGRVHILSSELWIGPRAPLGILYIAKWAYPGRFKEIDPQAVHRQWLMKWHGKELKGIYVYP